MASEHAPVLLLCLGYGDMPSFQREGDIMVARYKAYHPNMLRRAEGFGAFVQASIERYAAGAHLCVFRDPWGGAAALTSGNHWATVFEVNALPSWELSYTYGTFSGNHALRAKIADLERFCLRAADRLLTVSRVTAEALTRFGMRRPVDIVPNSPHPCFHADTASKAGRRIGYFGSLHAWQGVDKAVDALALLAPSYADVTLDIISSSRKDLRKAVRKRVRKRGLEHQVILREAMPVEQLSATVREWVFSLAPLLDTPRNTVQGCCPVKIIESMAAGVPVIASDLRAVREIIVNGDNGVLVRPGCRRSLASAMRMLLDDPALRDRLAKRGHTSISHYFGRERAHQRLGAIFADVVKRRKSIATQRRCSWEQVPG